MSISLRPCLLAFAIVTSLAACKPASTAEAKDTAVVAPSQKPAQTLASQAGVMEVTEVARGLEHP